MLPVYVTLLLKAKAVVSKMVTILVWNSMEIKLALLLWNSVAIRLALLLWSCGNSGIQCFPDCFGTIFETIGYLQNSAH